MARHAEQAVRVSSLRTALAAVAARPHLWLLGAITLLGGAARFWNLGWDGGAYAFHPDEWALNQVVIRLGPDLNPHFFFYGTFPIYLYRATAEFLHLLTGLNWLDPVRLPLIGRFYSALASTAMIPLLFDCGVRLVGRSTSAHEEGESRTGLATLRPDHQAGLLASAFAACAPLLLQAAHFGTVDTLVALAGVLTLWTSLRIIDNAGAGWYVFGGTVLGLALATKLSSGLYVLMPLVAHVSRRAREEDDRAIGPGISRSSRFTLHVWPLARSLWSGRLLVFFGSALVALLLAAPYYLLAWRDLWAAIVVQTDELQGGSAFSYLWQFTGATPYLFELQNLLVWGLGLPLGVTALCGWAWAVARCMRERSAASLLLAGWPLVYLVYIGTWQARFVRHTLPLVPFCCLFAAVAIVDVGGWGRGQQPRPVAGWRNGLGRVVGGVVLASSVAWGLAFMSIYATRDTRLQATDWVRANVPAGSRLVVEDPNTLVPVPDSDHPVSTYVYNPLGVTTPDTPAKMAQFARALASSDWLIVPNRRWSAVLPKLPGFPMTGRFYSLLAEGKLGYTPSATFASPPRLGPFSWSDDAAEETFQVFDHPTVRIYRNSGHLSEADLRPLLSAGP